MQNIFYTKKSIEDFSEKNEKLFPEAPQKCTYPDCTLPVKMKKHGYYKRFIISIVYTGYIQIRRYKCPVCGRTLSFLPIFCIPYYQYSAFDIIDMLTMLYRKDLPIKQLVVEYKKYFKTISRRHINYYKKRLITNRQLIQYGLNLMSPEFTCLGKIPENQAWVRNFLDKVEKMQTHIFLNNFFKETSTSFMTSQKRVA
jgi:transposase-like protein